jgi:excisionase family DNA binding protein
VNIVAEEHGVSTTTVRNWIANGVIPAYRIGRVIRMRRSEIDAALKPVASAD